MVTANDVPTSRSAPRQGAGIWAGASAAPWSWAPAAERDFSVRKESTFVSVTAPNSEREARVGIGALSVLMIAGLASDGARALSPLHGLRRSLHGESRVPADGEVSTAAADPSSFPALTEER
jgi:hypothetical protein